MARPFRNVYKSVGALIASAFGVATLFSLLNFTNMQFLHYKQLDNFLLMIDVLNKMYFHVKIEPLADLFDQNYKAKAAIKYIVIHHDTDTTTDHTPIIEINDYHKSKGWRSISYHYYVSRSGVIYNIHNEYLITPQTLNFNEVSFGICLQGDFNKQYPTQEQIESLTMLLLRLKIKFDVENSNIIGHREANHDTDCPGRNLNLYAIKQNLNKSHFLQPLYKFLVRWYKTL